jgi:hypothetical protein
MGTLPAAAAGQTRMAVRATLVGAVLATERTLQEQQRQMRWQGVMPGTVVKRLLLLHLKKVPAADQKPTRLNGQCP